MPLITSLGLLPIHTSYDPKPGPNFNFDWSATFDPYDESELVGWGRTERAAILDLLEQHDEQVLDAVGDLPAHPAHLSGLGPSQRPSPDGERH
jgi:hypothetical protein